MTCSMPLRFSSRAVAIMLTLAMLSACGARVIPAGTGTPPAPRNNPAATPSADRAAVPVPATPVAPQEPPAATGDSNAAGLGVVSGPAVSSLGLGGTRGSRTVVAFALSCPGLMRRPDNSGLTSPGDWNEACAAASDSSGSDAGDFFERYFVAVQVGDGRSLATGYFEPEIAGSRTRAPGYEVPVYARPRDLVDVELGDFASDLAGRKIRGKLSQTRLVPYDDRTAIESGSLEGRAAVIAWAADAVEFFFLQVQGSGRLRLPDGGIMRIGYASQNGQPYTGIGALMKTRGLLAPGESSMQGIMAWLRRNPDEGRRIMQENRSVVFFSELTGDGPKGAMGYVVTPEISVAADPKFVPLGAPVWLSLDRAEPNGIWIAQDTGGAIKGSNRFDTFWGAGDRARAIAGGMSARGSALVLLPKVAAARLGLAPAPSQ